MKKKLIQLLSRMEVVVGLLLVVIFMVWFMDKCGQSQAAHQPVAPTPTEQPTASSPLDSAAPSSPTTAQPVAQPTAAATKPALSVLYVGVDSLKIRSQPNLSGAVLTQLPKGAEVYFLGERTTFTQKITLNNRQYDEPWVMVQTSQGIKGWVYGGGVKYYK